MLRGMDPCLDALMAMADGPRIFWPKTDFGKSNLVQVDILVYLVYQFVILARFKKVESFT